LEEGGGREAERGRWLDEEEEERKETNFYDKKKKKEIEGKKERKTVG
jgi:hypothetical protein